VLAFIALLWLWRIYHRRSVELRTPRERIVGEARGFQSRTEQIAFVTQTIWSFRVERYSSSGALPAFPVEMRGVSFYGSIAEGDRVEVHASASDGRSARARWVRNITSGSLVEAREVADRLPLIMFGSASILVTVLGFLLTSSGVK
jgi:hypothetical protein